MVKELLDTDFYCKLRIPVQFLTNYYMNINVKIRNFGIQLILI